MCSLWHNASRLLPICLQIVDGELNHLLLDAGTHCASCESWSRCCSASGSMLRHSHSPAGAGGSGGKPSVSRVTRFLRCVLGGGGADSLLLADSCNAGCSADCLLTEGDSLSLSSSCLASLLRRFDLRGGSDLPLPRRTCPACCSAACSGSLFVAPLQPSGCCCSCAKRPRRACLTADFECASGWSLNGHLRLSCAVLLGAITGCVTV